MIRRFSLAVLGVGLLAAPMASGQHAGKPAVAHTAAFELYIDDVYTQQTGGEGHSVSFRDPLTRQLNPGLKVNEGESVVIHLRNRSFEPHGFAIMGVAGASSATIPAGGSATIKFKAPGPGGYVYHDPLQAGAKGARTLFGDFTVLARAAAH